MRELEKMKKGFSKVDDYTKLWLHPGSRSDDLETLVKRDEIARNIYQDGIVDKIGYRC